MQICVYIYIYIAFLTSSQLLCVIFILQLEHDFYVNEACWYCVNPTENSVYFIIYGKGKIDFLFLLRSSSFNCNEGVVIPFKDEAKV